MTRSNQITESSNAGELTLRLHARTAFSKYSSGLETCENLIPLAEGGLMRRAGTRYVAELKSSSVKGRLKPFEFSTKQAYMTELGNLVMRFYRHQAQITAGDTDASITNGTFPSNITDWDDRSTGGAGNAIAHDVTNGRLTLQTSGTASDDIGWAEQDVVVGAAFDTNEHVLKFHVLGAPGDRIELRIGTATLGSQIVSDVKFEVGYHCHAFTPGDGNNTVYIQFRNRGNFRDKDVQIDDVSLIDNTAVEIDTPYTEAQLFQVNGPQSADVLYLFHPSHPTYKLLRLGHTSWSLVEVAWVDGPYLKQNTSATTLLPSAATGLGINLTLSAVTGVNDDQGWLSTDIGRLVRYQKAGAGAWGYAVIVSITSTTVAVADVREDFQATPSAATAFRLGLWSGTTGYPSIGAFYEQRLFAANSTDQPQSWWASQTADFENQTPDDLSGTVADDDALDYTISADNVNAIRWLSPGEDTLVIGTTGGEWTPSSVGAVITPSDVVVRRHTTHGSANIQPVRIGNVVLFVQKAARKVREFGFSFEVDGFRAFDMTRLAQHVTFSGIDEMAFAQEPDSLVWAVRGDGQLLSMTFRREEDVVGWARHIIGGSFNTGDPVVESVAVIPGANGSGQVQDSTSRDEVWITVKRTINSVTRRFIEVLERDFETGHEQEDSYYIDSCITLDTPVTISAATKADPVVVTATGHGLSGGNEGRITQVLGMTELNGNSYRLADILANSVALTANGNETLITGATQANPVVISAPGHPYSNGDIVGIFESVGMTEINNITFKVANKTANGFELNTAADAAIDGTGYTAWTSSGKIYHATDGSVFTAYDSAGQVRLKTSAISGLDHLEGEVVSILADGSVHPTRTVSSGAITLDAVYSVAQIGLAYTHKLKTLKISGGTASGTPVGRTKRIFGVTFVVLNSHTISFGPDADNLFDDDFRAVADPMDKAAPFFSGEKFLEYDGDWDTDSRIIVQNADPVPYMQLAAAYETDIREVR